MKKIAGILILLSFIISTCDVPDARDVEPPLMRIIYPNEGAVVSDNINIIINATDDDEIQTVWCYVDGVRIGESASIPYSIPFNITGWERKITHVVQAMAIDKTGNTGNSESVNFIIAESPDFEPPTVAIMNPQTGQTVENTVRILAHADDDRSVQKVAFFIDGDSVYNTYTYPYTYDWVTSTYSDSTQHTIFAKAYDSGGNSAVSPVVSVTVYPRSGSAGDAIPPTALFLYPAGTITTITGEITVSVDIQDASAISEAEFFVDGILTREQANPDIPWTFTWDTSSKADGLPHTLFVKATDAAGNIGSTALLTVTIN